ncbi:MAG: hypothetical protein KJO38_07780, partial [Gammaproteobacteria bacterium]|nr:hypothetical protein [Gammaproteobacteria bacterium]
LEHPPAGLSPLAGVRYASCWTTALGFERSPGVRCSSVRSSGSIAWAAAEHSKPGRTGKPVWLVQASAAFSAAHADASSLQAGAELGRQLAALLDTPLVPSFSWSRFWRYAFVETPLARDYLISSEHGIAYAGDACRGSRVEHAFASGTALGREIAAQVHP